MVKLTERLRILSLLAAIGELSERHGGPSEGVELLDMDTSHRWLFRSEHRPFASISSLHANGYLGEDDQQMRDDLVTLIGGGYVALTVVRDAYALTPAGLAVYQGHAEFKWEK